MFSRSITFIWHAAVVLILIAATTAFFVRVIPANATTAGFAFLLLVLGISAAWGLAEAVLASVAATLCFNFFFLPPLGKFTIADPQNWVALFAFLATALVASHLSDRGKKRALEAKSHQRETEQLYTLSRTILLTDPAQSIGFQAAQHIAEIFNCRAVVLYDARTADIFRAGTEDLPEIESQLRTVAGDGTNRCDSDVAVAAIVLGGRPIGSVAAAGLALSDSAFKALLNLVAISLERVRTEEAARRAVAARHSEEFKSMLLDAIAHEFKTPLTSIKAASTSMRADPLLSPQSHELASIIDEEADRMNLLVTEAVRMSQIDAGKVRLDRQSLAITDLLRDVLASFEPRSEGRELKLLADDRLPAVHADRDLVSLALRQLVDNSLKYSPPGSPIEVSIGLTGSQVVIRVHDRGPNIPERERERIFQKFYRWQGTKTHVPGTGLGLYIAREIIRTHGGDVWVEGEPGSGSQFCVSLPAETDGHHK